MLVKVAEAKFGNLCTKSCISKLERPCALFSHVTPENAALGLRRVKNPNLRANLELLKVSCTAREERKVPKWRCRPRPDFSFDDYEENLTLMSSKSQ